MKCLDCGNEKSKVYSESLDACLNCGQFIEIKTPKEPEKIPSLYDHNKARLKLIAPYNANKAMLDEAAVLIVWLKYNKPEIWTSCDKDNTNIGDTVICKMGKTKYVVEFIARESNRFSCWNENSKETNMNFHLSNFKINTYKEE